MHLRRQARPGRTRRSSSAGPRRVAERFDPANEDLRPQWERRNRSTESKGKRKDGPAAPHGQSKRLKAEPLEAVVGSFVAKVKPWSGEENRKLLVLVSKHGEGDWGEKVKQLGTGCDPPHPHQTQPDAQPVPCITPSVFLPRRTAHNMRTQWRKALRDTAQGVRALSSGELASGKAAVEEADEESDAVEMKEVGSKWTEEEDDFLWQLISTDGGIRRGENNWESISKRMGRTVKGVQHRWVKIEAQPRSPAKPVKRRAGTAKPVKRPAGTARRSHTVELDPTFPVGLRCDARDRFGGWWNAKIIKVDDAADTRLVHFHGWGEKYDEWIPIAAPKFSALNTKSLEAPPPPPTNLVVRKILPQRATGTDVKTREKLIEVYTTLFPNQAEADPQFLSDSVHASVNFVLAGKQFNGDIEIAGGVSFKHRPGEGFGVIEYIGVWYQRQVTAIPPAGPVDGCGKSRRCVFAQGFGTTLLQALWRHLRDLRIKRMDPIFVYVDLNAGKPSPDLLDATQRRAVGLTCGCLLCAVPFFRTHGFDHVPDDSPDRDRLTAAGVLEPSPATLMVKRSLEVQSSTPSTTQPKSAARERPVVPQKTTARLAPQKMAARPATSSASKVPAVKLVPKRHTVPKLSSGGKWTEEEDDVLRQLIEDHGTGDWDLKARHFQGRTGKSLKHRYSCVNPGMLYFDDKWTEDEDKLLRKLVATKGADLWDQKATQFPNRTASGIAKRWKRLQSYAPTKASGRRKQTRLGMAART